MANTLLASSALRPRCGFGRNTRVATSCGMCDRFALSDRSLRSLKRERMVADASLSSRRDERLCRLKLSEGKRVDQLRERVGTKPFRKPFNRARDLCPSNETATEVARREETDGLGQDRATKLVLVGPDPFVDRPSGDPNRVLLLKVFEDLCVADGLIGERQAVFGQQFHACLHHELTKITASAATCRPSAALGFVVLARMLSRYLAVESVRGRRFPSCGFEPSDGSNRRGIRPDAGCETVSQTPLNHTLRLRHIPSKKVSEQRCYLRSSCG